MAVIESKFILKSSTVVINLIPVVVLLLEYVTKNYVVDAELMLLLTALVNILNRFRAPKTVQPLKLM